MKPPEPGICAGYHLLLVDCGENLLVLLLQGIEAFILRGCHEILLAVGPAIAAPFRSSASSVSLVLKPPPKPVSFPVLPITRWQGTTTGMGLAPLARPTARDPLGFPILRASSPYEIVSP